MSDTRWLSEDEQRTWSSFLTASRMFWDRLERQLQNDARLPHAYYEILVRLSEAPDRTVRMSQLASSSLTSRSRLSHAVARMEEQGWVRRRPYDGDGRGLLAELTDAGMARLEAAAPGHVTEVRTLLFDALTDEQVRQLGEISAALEARLSERPGCPTAPDEPACPPDEPACPPDEPACRSSEPACPASEPACPESDC